MPELPYQTWARLMGSNWPPLSQLAVLYQQAGINAPAGSATGNVALQNRLLSGWRPGQAALVQASAPSPAPAPAPSPAPSASSGDLASILSLLVQPGLQQQMEQQRIALEKYIADLQNQLSQAAEQRVSRAQEAQLAANPTDFVAYELYKQALERGGSVPSTGPSRTGAEIGNLFEAILGGRPSSVAGTGQFGVQIPTASSISRSQLGEFSPTDLGILTSFLNAGIQTPEGKFMGINPEDYFSEVQRGLIPTLQTGRTQYQF